MSVDMSTRTTGLRRLIELIMTAVAGLAASSSAGDSSTGDLEDGAIVEIAPASSPGEPRSYYFNGMDTEAWLARIEGQRIQSRLGGQLSLVFVDCSRVDVRLGEFRDWPAVLSSKLGSFDTELNAAVDTALPRVLEDLRAGLQVNLIGYSLGGAVIQNLVNELRERVPASDREMLLGRLCVLLIAAASFGEWHPLSDGWPELGGLTSISDVRDPVPAWWGDVDDCFLGTRAERHLLSNYLPHVSANFLDRRHARIVVDGPDRVLLEEVRRAPRREDRVIRVRVWNLPDDPERSSINFNVPSGWRRLSWRIVGETDSGAADRRVIWMRDLSFWPDSPVLTAQLSHGSRTDAQAVARGYLRVDRSGGEEFVVEIRPEE